MIISMLCCNEYVTATGRKSSFQTVLSVLFLDRDWFLKSHSLCHLKYSSIHNNKNDWKLFMSSSGKEIKKKNLNEKDSQASSFHRGEKKVVRYPLTFTIGHCDAEDVAFYFFFWMLRWNRTVDVTRSNSFIRTHAHYSKLICLRRFFSLKLSTWRWRTPKFFTKKKSLCFETLIAHWRGETCSSSKLGEGGKNGNWVNVFPNSEKREEKSELEGKVRWEASRIRT